MRVQDPCKLLTELTPLKHTPKSRDPEVPPACPESPGVFVEDLKGEPSSAFLSTFKECAKDYAPKCILPRSLGDLFNPGLVGEPLHILIEEGAQLMEGLKVTKEQVADVELATRGQCLSNDWHEQRQGRITASLIKRISSMNLENPSNTVVNQICHPRKQRKGKSDKGDIAALR